jgi:uncharacterized membrane protein
MESLHPFIVHFPIALIIVSSLFDTFGAFKNHLQSTKTAFYLQLMGALGGILAAFTGNLAETAIRSQEQLSLNVSESLGTHISWGNASVWIILIVVLGRTFAILEKKEWASSSWIFASLSLMLSGLVLITGLYGGQLSTSVLQYFINH